MAFQMVHMEIAYRLLEHLPQIENAAEFLLGSVAPDSVHMNPAYRVDMKVKSHMFEGCGQWSDTQDYPRWVQNIHQVFQRTVCGTEAGAYRDFAAGLCVHCLTDYWNDLRIWRTLQKKYIPPMNPEEFKAAYYPEARGMDWWLYQNSPNTAAVTGLLAEASAIEVAGLVEKENMERQRNHLLYTQYQVETVDISAYRFLSADSIEAFMEATVNDIGETILTWLHTA